MLNLGFILYEQVMLYCLYISKSKLNIAKARFSMDHMVILDNLYEMES